MDHSFRLLLKPDAPAPDPAKCNHEYAEGWFNRTVWRCNCVAGHGGWHTDNRKVWDDKGVLKEHGGVKPRKKRKVT